MASRCECAGCYEDGTQKVNVVVNGASNYEASIMRVGFDGAPARIVHVCPFHEDKLRRTGGYLTAFRGGK